MNLKENSFPSIRGMFENYFISYIRVLRTKLFAYENIIIIFENIESGIHQIVNGVMNQISEIAIYSLIDFYQFQKKQKKNLTYNEFNDQLLQDSFLREFHTIYPKVEELCEASLNNYTEKIYEILDTLIKYKNEIQKFLGTTRNKHLHITEIDLFQGDYHKQTFVAILTMDEKKFVLKKHCNIGERILKIYEEIYLRENLTIPVAKTKNLSDILEIQEYIEKSEIFTEKEIDDYYFKFGLMMGIFTVLGTKDLHNENVIATNRGPYFIDLEVAITPQMIPKGYSLLKETFLINCSETKMVYGDIDLSAFSGKQVSVMCSSILKKGTDDICVGLIEKTLVSSNIPKDVKGKEIELEKYIPIMMIAQCSIFL